MNPFNRKSMEKVLFATYMPTAPDKRRARKYLRKMARRIESAWKIGRRDGLDGKSLIPLKDLPQNEDSLMGREMAHKAYVAYQAGHRTGSTERKGVTAVGCF